MTLKTLNLSGKLNRFLSQRAMALIAAAAVLVSLMAATGWANALYILTGTEDGTVVLDGVSPAPDLSTKLIYLTTSSTGYDVTLSSGKMVTICRKGSVTNARSRSETISALLDRLHITLDPEEMVAVDLSSPTGVTLAIGDELTYEDTVTEAVTAATVRVPTATLPKGTERVAQVGQDGIRVCRYRYRWSGGQLVSQELLEEVSNTAQNRIAEYGTTVTSVDSGDELVNVVTREDGSGTLYFASGATMNFSGTKSMTATAYNKNEPKVGTITATGTKVRAGVAAVDKRVIPLGTRLYVTNTGADYGYAVAEDTGVRGNIIDLYHEVYSEVSSFGRRRCTVSMLE